MAITIKHRGKRYTFIYYYQDGQERSIQQYESYHTQEEAEQRVRIIEFLKQSHDENTVSKLAREYNELKQPHQSPQNGNLSKTFSEFIWIWATRHARKVKMKPNSYSSLDRNIRNHIEPYFGNKVVSKITPEDVEAFLFEMNTKKCKGAKTYNKDDDEIPTLKGSTVMKVFNILRPAFRDAEKWGYTKKSPVSGEQAPSYKYAKRNFYTKEEIKAVLEKIDDPLLHLAVHLAFICSLRPGETVGIDAGSIKLENESLWIKQTLQRVEEKALQAVSQEEIIRIFPKKKTKSKTVMILKTPKTDKSVRKGFLNTPLCQEIAERMKQITKGKEYYGDRYHDYGLLFCYENGDPIEPRMMNRRFTKWQKEQGCIEENLVDMQGIRKSATMYKLRLTNYDLQVVGGDGGQTSPTTILNHYDEVLEGDRRRLSALVENDFYRSQEDVLDEETERKFNLQMLMGELSKSPDLAAKVYSLLPALQQTS